MPPPPSHHSLPIIGVMGSGKEPHIIKATRVGEWLGTLPVHLLTGGGGGVMEAASKAFHAVKGRKGNIIGILPGDIFQDSYHPCNGYPNPWVEIPIRTHLPLSGARGTDLLSRNHINILSSDIIIALPGAAGTASEVVLAHRYNKPLIAWLDSPVQIPGLPDSALSVSKFTQVQDFVMVHLERLAM